MVRFSLDEIKKSNAASELNFINRGIEKESLRIDSAGKISQTSHPEGLGSALTNPYITTDFSEALLELVTPTFTSASECLEFLKNLHVFVNQNLEEESLWPLSMPCSIESEEEIPIGNYGTSNQGMMKTIYRRGLSNRYGSMMQAIAGIHYNFSFSDKFLKTLADISAKEIKEFKNEVYLGIARNFRRYGWLYLLLYGSSPVASKTFAKNREHDLHDLNAEDLFKAHSTSLRMGDLGYISHAQDSLNISYNSIEEYSSDLKNALKTTYQEYKELGEFKAGERVQLNDSIIQIENEYYSTIRPKRVCPTGERPINILNKEGIDYLELRCIDLNPNSFVGISEEQIYFLDLLILYSFFTESPDISEAESNQLFKTHKTVVNEGRKIGARITTSQGDATIKEEALRVLAGMKEIANFMDKEVSEEANSKWSDTLDNQKKIIENLDLSLSGMLLNEIENKGITFQEYGLNLSRTHKKQMDNLEIDKRHFSNSSKESLLAAKKIEEEPQVNFEVYLKDFLDKIS
jgi:glutamate--cysteine ligase